MNKRVVAQSDLKIIIYDIIPIIINCMNYIYYIFVILKVNLPIKFLSWYT